MRGSCRLLTAAPRSRLLGAMRWATPTGRGLVPRWALLCAGVCWLIARPVAPWVLGAATLLGLLVVERGIAGVAAARRWHDPAALLFPVAHLLRDLAWVAAMGRWLTRRIVGVPLAPAHSMHPRAARALAIPAAEEP